MNSSLSQGPLPATSSAPTTASTPSSAAALSGASGGSPSPRHRTSTSATSREAAPPTEAGGSRVTTRSQTMTSAPSRSAAPSASAGRSQSPRRHTSTSAQSPSLTLAVSPVAFAAPPSTATTEVLVLNVNGVPFTVADVVRLLERVTILEGQLQAMQQLHMQQVRRLEDEIKSLREETSVRTV